MQTQIRRCLTSMVLLAMAGSAAHAQVERSGGGGELQRFMQQYQQVSSEKTALQAQVTQLKQDLDSAKSELAAAKKDRDALKGRAAQAASIAQVTAARDAAEKNLDLYKRQMTDLIARFRETATNLKEIEADRANLRGQLQERNTAFDKCAENNTQLYEITTDVLNRYEHVGTFTKLTMSEPFTKITRTRVENLVDDYRARAQENRTKDSRSQ
jgi:chromosome segregation ATPase